MKLFTRFCSCTHSTFIALSDGTIHSIDSILSLNSVLVLDEDDSTFIWDGYSIRSLSQFDSHHIAKRLNDLDGLNKKVIARSESDESISISLVNEDNKLFVSARDSIATVSDEDYRSPSSVNDESVLEGNCIPSLGASKLTLESTIAPQMLFNNERIEQKIFDLEALNIVVFHNCQIKTTQLITANTELDLIEFSGNSELSSVDLSLLKAKEIRVGCHVKIDSTTQFPSSPFADYSLELHSSVDIKSAYNNYLRTKLLSSLLLSKEDISDYEFPSGIINATVINACNMQRLICSGTVRMNEVAFVGYTDLSDADLTKVVMNKVRIDPTTNISGTKFPANILEEGVLADNASREHVIEALAQAKEVTTRSSFWGSPKSSPAGSPARSQRVNGSF